MFGFSGSWGNQRVMPYIVEPDAVTLDGDFATIDFRASSGHQVLELQATSTPFGKRWWWSCPRCGRRCKRLYSTQWNLRLACHICHDFVYESSQLSRYQNTRGIGALWPPYGHFRQEEKDEEREEAALKRRREKRHDLQNFTERLDNFDKHSA